MRHGGYFNQLGRYLGSPRSQHGHQCQPLVWRPNGQHGYGLWQLNCEGHGTQEWHPFVLVNKLKYCFPVDTEMVNQLGLPVCPLPIRTWRLGCDTPLQQDLCAPYSLHHLNAGAGKAPGTQKRFSLQAVHLCTSTALVQMVLEGCYPAAKATAWTWPGHSLRLCALLCALCELQCRHGVPSPSTVSLALPDSGSCHLPAPPQIPAELPPRSWLGRPLEASFPRTSPGNTGPTSPWSLQTMPLAPCSLASFCLASFLLVKEISSGLAQEYKPHRPLSTGQGQIPTVNRQLISAIRQTENPEVSKGLVPSPVIHRIPQLSPRHNLPSQLLLALLHIPERYCKLRPGFFSCGADDFKTILGKSSWIKKKRGQTLAINQRKELWILRRERKPDLRAKQESFLPADIKAAPLGRSSGNRGSILLGPKVMD
ncbi:LOW QUALITY PROTEIN: hypothetical protein U0070_002865 [Myodes glareolus]|uniref:Uncharacterized protein n=1 Tax=Myodes glareolus TaxID=447135 RepID=A0AAW0IHV0_MYOGA